MDVGIDGVGVTVTGALGSAPQPHARSGCCTPRTTMACGPRCSSGTGPGPWGVADGRGEVADERGEPGPRGGAGSPTSSACRAGTASITVDLESLSGADGPDWSRSSRCCARGCRAVTCSPSTSPRARRWHRTSRRGTGSLLSPGWPRSCSWPTTSNGPGQGRARSAAVSRGLSGPSTSRGARFPRADSCSGSLRTAFGGPPVGSIGSTSVTVSEARQLAATTRRGPRWVAADGGMDGPPPESDGPVVVRQPINCPRVSAWPSACTLAASPSGSSQHRTSFPHADVGTIGTPLHRPD